MKNDQTIGILTSVFRSKCLQILLILCSVSLFYAQPAPDCGMGDPVVVLPNNPGNQNYDISPSEEVTENFECAGTNCNPDGGDGEFCVVMEFLGVTTGVCLHSANSGWSIVHPSTGECTEVSNNMDISPYLIDDSGAIRAVVCKQSAGNISVSVEASGECESIPTGACCLPDGSCEVTTEGDCISNGGDYQGDDMDCGSVDCGFNAQPSILLMKDMTEMGSDPWIVTITYKITNNGNSDLVDLTLEDDLDDVFGAGNYMVTGISSSGDQGTNFHNPSFDGTNVIELIAASQDLDQGEMETITATVELHTLSNESSPSMPPEIGEYINEAVVEGTISGSATSVDDDDDASLLLVPPDPIPTLSEWGMIILGLCLLIFGMVYITQRKTAL